MASFQAAVTTLNTLIANVPEQMRPVLNHIGQMLISADSAFTQHMSANESEFGQVNAVLGNIAQRASDLETNT